MAANNFHFNSPRLQSCSSHTSTKHDFTSGTANSFAANISATKRTPSRSDLQQESQQTNGGALIVAEKLEAELKKLQADFEKLRGESYD
eukprot:UN02331